MAAEASEPCIRGRLDSPVPIGQARDSEKTENGVGYLQSTFFWALQSLWFGYSFSMSPYQDPLCPEEGHGAHAF